MPTDAGRCARGAGASALPQTGAAPADVYAAYRRLIAPYGVGNRHRPFLRWVHGGGTAGGRGDPVGSLTGARRSADSLVPVAADSRESDVSGAVSRLLHRFKFPPRIVLMVLSAVLFPAGSASFGMRGSHQLAQFGVLGALAAVAVIAVFSG